MMSATASRQSVTSLKIFLEFSLGQNINEQRHSLKNPNTSYVAENHLNFVVFIIFCHLSTENWLQIYADSSTLNDGIEQTHQILRIWTITFVSFPAVNYCLWNLGWKLRGLRLPVWCSNSPPRIGYDSFGQCMLVPCVHLSDALTQHLALDMYI